MEEFFAHLPVDLALLDLCDSSDVSMAARLKSTVLPRI
jgi:hypothetical protein